MLQRAGNDAGIYHQTGSVNNSNTVLGNNTSPSSLQFQERTLTLLHFFYIVRLAQQGFFTLISQSYPNVEPNALIHLCDKLVGGSLFAVKDPVEDIRTNKQNEVFTLLQKLHEGVDEPIDDQFTTTFENVHHLITHFIHSTMPTLPSSSQSQQQVPDNNDHHNGNEQQQLPPPIWLVVPFTGMINNGSNLSNLTSSLSSATPPSWQHSKSKSKPLPPSFSEEPKNKHLKSYSIEVSPNNSASSSKWSNQYKQSSSSDHTSKSSTPLPTTPDITHENSPPTITSTTDNLVKVEDKDKEVEKNKPLSSTASSKELSEPIVTAEDGDLTIKGNDNNNINKKDEILIMKLLIKQKH
ncbi:hypothetical protein BJ944DRAFT_99461 [Cunninghamella echinulata]|nr:hypothetical protein BJ944DRAFT_99461 [Cunninghamella echinulata]